MFELLALYSPDHSLTQWSLPYSKQRYGSNQLEYELQFLIR